MAIAAEIIIEYSKIAPLFEAGVERAKKTGRATLVSYSQLVPAADPLYFFAERQQTGVNAFYWEHPADNFAIAGVGIARIFKGAGPNRFEAVQAEWGKITMEAVVGGAAGWGVGPLLMGGFSFDPARQGTALWRGYGDGSLVLPRLLLTRKEGGTYLTVNALVAENSDPDSLARQAAHLYRAPAAPLSEMDSSNSLQLEDVMPAQDWQATVAEAVGQIRQGAFQKVVLAREVQVTAAKIFEVGTVLGRLRQNFPDATIFAVAREGRVFVGATPERLVQLQAGEVLTAALAGSIGRGATPSEDEKLGQELLQSAKNQGEHAVVADIIHEALQKVCVDVYKGEPPRLLKLRNVQHLYTPITGRLHCQGTILQLVEALHPTPALGGFPRSETLAFIRQHEGLDRGWYGAPLGWLDCRGEGEFVVAIRSALLDSNKATLFAGCGIVADSEPASEYQESRLKLKAMLSALA